MLDRIAPLEKKAFVSGVNKTIYDFSSSVTPVLFGWISDTYGSGLAQWICVGLSVLAALVNVPLLFNPRLGKPAAKSDEAVASTDEATLQDLLGSGKYLPIKDQRNLNETRKKNGQPSLRMQVGKYDSGALQELREMSTQELKFFNETTETDLANLHADPSAKREYVDAWRSNRLDHEAFSQMKKEMGEWVTDYLEDIGYFTALDHAQVLKMLLIKSLPPISEEADVTEENVEQLLVNSSRLINNRIEPESKGTICLLKKCKSN